MISTTSEVGARIPGRPGPPIALLLLLVGIAALAPLHPARATAPADSAVGSEDPFAGDVLVRYNRVDGAAVGGRLRWRSPRGPERSAAFEWTYAVSRVRGLFRLSGAQAFGAAERFRLTGALYRRTAGFAFDDERMGNLENTLSSLLFADDNRDHFEARGGGAALEWRPTAPAILTLGFTRETEDPLPNATDAALFNADPFRDNPAATAGTLSALRLTLVHDPRTGLTDNGLPFRSTQWRPRGYRVRGSVETAGAGLGGDFRHAVAWLEAGLWWPVAPGHAFAARAWGGRSISGRLTPQAEFAAGGATTLRGHRHKVERGDRMALINLEYAAAIHGPIELLALFDSGAAWRSDQAPNGVRWALDGGGGVQTHDQRLRMIIARPLRDSAAPWILSIRTRVTF